MTITLNVGFSVSPNLNLTAEQIKAYKNAINSQLNSTFQEVSGGLVSAVINFDGPKNPEVYNFDIELTETISTIGIYSFGAKKLSVNPLLADDVQEVSESVIHELFHTLALGELSENYSINGIPDTEFTFNEELRSYMTTSSTDKNILSNAMNYNYIKIDGISFKEKYKSNTGLNKLTKGQLNFLINSIYKQMKGYGLWPKYNKNETYQEQLQKVKEYYYDYWGNEMP